MWCNNLAWWCKKSTFAPHLKHAKLYNRYEGFNNSKEDK